jgi:hypothetical protein
MQIWLGVVETVLALIGLGMLLLLYFLSEAIQLGSALVRASVDDFRKSLKESEERAEMLVKSTTERIEASNKEVLAGVKSLRESWEALSVEIKTRYENYDKAQRLALRQIQAVEYLDKLIRSMGGKTRRPVSDNISTPSESDAAAIEELSEAERQVLVNTASGIGRNDDEFGG